MAEVTARMPVPAPYVIECAPEDDEHYGLTDPRTQTIYVYEGDTLASSLRHTVAHELCHAYRYTSVDDARLRQWADRVELDVERTSSIYPLGQDVEEAWADACATAWLSPERVVPGGRTMVRHILGEWAPPVSRRVKLFQMRHLR